MSRKFSSNRLDELTYDDLNYFLLPVANYFGLGGFHSYTLQRDLNLPKLLRERASSLVCSDVRREATTSGKEVEYIRRLLY